MSRLVAIKLTWELCQRLAPKVTPADAKECAASGHTVLQALVSGLFMGKAYAVVPEDKLDEPVGAFGFTQFHTIWSLWSKLSRRQSLQVLRETPDWVAGMSLRARPHTLCNYVDPDNEVAVKWLKDSGAFHVNKHPHFIPNRGPALYFEARKAN